jgi:hypothetical protein
MRLNLFHWKAASLHSNNMTHGGHHRHKTQTSTIRAWLLYNCRLINPSNNTKLITTSFFAIKQIAKHNFAEINYFDSYQKYTDHIPWRSDKSLLPGVTIYLIQRFGCSARQNRLLDNTMLKKHYQIKFQDICQISKICTTICASGSDHSISPPTQKCHAYFCLQQSKVYSSQTTFEASQRLVSKAPSKTKWQEESPL